MRGLVSFATEEVPVHDDGFEPHFAIRKWLAEAGSVLPTPTWERIQAPPRYRIYEGWSPLLDGYAVVTAVLETRSPMVKFAGTKLYGSDQLVSPQFTRSEEKVILRGRGFSPKTILRLDAGANGGLTKNGQGTTIQACTFDFSTMQMRMNPEHPTLGIFSNSWVLRYGTSTGKWRSMGWRHDLDQHTEEEWMALLAPMLGWPGFYTLTETERNPHRFLRELDRPDAVVTAGGDFHEKANDKGYVDYGDEVPWFYRAGKDQHGKSMRSPDAQHMTHYCAALECARRWPLNQVFRLITKALASRWGLQINDRGPQANYSVDRAGGRILLTGCDLWWALQGHGETDLAIEVADRTSLVLRKVLDIFKANPEWPWDDFGGDSDVVAVNEVGIMFAGLRDVLNLLNDLGIAQQGMGWADEIEAAMTSCAKFCFESFKWYSNGFGIPWTRHRDGSDSGSKSGGTDFVYAAARAHVGGDPLVMAELVAMESRIPPKYR